MPQVNILQWRAGRGWLVLAGGGPLDSGDVQNIEASLLRNTLSLGPIAYIWAAGDIEAADRHMDALRDLGARTGYLVDILSETDDELAERLGEAGVIIFGDGPQQETLREALPGVVLRSVEEAFMRGASVYGVGRSATLWGAAAVENGAPVVGFNWLAHALIVPGYTPADADALRERLQHVRAARYGVGLGEGAALALGPRGEVEIWGSPAVTIALGPDIEVAP